MKLVENNSNSTIMADGKAYLKGEQFKVSNEIFEFVKPFVRLIDETEEKIDLNKLKNEDLRTMLDEKGIEYTDKDTKAELIAKLGA